MYVPLPVLPSVLGREACRCGLCEKPGLCGEILSLCSSKRQDLSFNFAFGYSIEHPNLFEELDFLNRIESVQGRFLQMDGMAFRTPEEADALMKGLVTHGIRRVNFTFYGLEAYHDRFAGRKGDFAYLLTLAKSAVSNVLETSVGIPLTSENAEQTEELIELLEK